MLRRAELLVCLALAPGCSLVFPLEDAPDVPDAPPPPSCPAPGLTPTFESPTLHIFDTRRCKQYTTSTAAGLAVGPCDAGVGGPIEVFEGEIAAPLAPASIVLQRKLSSAVINPEGTWLITLESNLDGSAIETYERSSVAWTHLAETVIDQDAPLGTPSAGPDARLAYFVRPDPIVDPGANNQVVELQAGSDGQWEPVMTYDSPFGELEPIAFISGLHLTANGLAVVFTVNNPDSTSRRLLGYADRESLDQPFGAARAITFAASDLFNDSSLGNDCARVYLTDFTGLSFIAQD